MTETPEARSPEAHVPGYLLPSSILATLFCCLPVGIVAIIFSAQARSRSQIGDYAGAARAVRNANISLIITVVLGILFTYWSSRSSFSGFSSVPPANSNTTNPTTSTISP